jgi:VanZ family protein
MSPARRWTPVLAYMAGIYALSSISHTPSLPGQSDKGLHALLYAGLGALLMRAVAGGWSAQMTRTAVVISVLLGGLYGASDEYHQSFVAARQSDVRDLAADIVGSAIGASACLGWSRWRRGATARSV